MTETNILESPSPQSGGAEDKDAASVQTWKLNSFPTPNSEISHNGTTNPGS
jgi:hypothetical protein